MTKLAEQRSTRHMGAGLTMAVVVGLFAYLGHLLDGVTDLEPLFLLLGLLLGSVGGFLHVVAVAAPEMLPFGKGRKTEEKSSQESSKTSDPK
jgi:F0F1-type ATP synthase assembly protein I